MIPPRPYAPDGEGGSGGTIGGGGGPPPLPSPGPTLTSTPAPAPPANQAVLPDIIASSIDSSVSIRYFEIPLSAAPSQVIAVQLGLQSCRIAVYQKRTGLYLDLYRDDLPVVLGVLCRDRVWLIRNAYLGFLGDLTFVDRQGVADPDHTGLGVRFSLLWGTT